MMTSSHLVIELLKLPIVLEKFSTLSVYSYVLATLCSRTAPTSIPFFLSGNLWRKNRPISAILSSSSILVYSRNERNRVPVNKQRRPGQSGSCAWVIHRVLISFACPTRHCSSFHDRTIRMIRIPHEFARDKNHWMGMGIFEQFACTYSCGTLVGFISVS